MKKDELIIEIPPGYEAKKPFIYADYNKTPHYIIIHLTKKP